MDDKPSVLVVDDEPGLARMISIFLEKSGYQVTSCGDAASGLAHVKHDPGAFRVVIADLTLPDMTGDAMSMQMLDINPELGILICSGYPFDIESVPAAKRSRMAVLQKPFMPDMLRGAVAELLAR